MLYVGKGRKVDKNQHVYLINLDSTGSYSDMSTSASSPILHTTFFRVTKRAKAGVDANLACRLRSMFCF